MRSPLPPFALLALCCAAAPLRAQQTSTAARPAAPRPTVTQTASINLLGFPLGFASGEYERAVGRNGFAVGVGGLATFDGRNDGLPYADNSDRFASAQAKLKYYLGANGLRGFAVGVTAGIASARGYQYVWQVTDSAYGYTVGTSRRATVTRPTLGAALDYNFLIGRQRRFLIGTGIGARRVLGGGRRDTYVGGGFTDSYKVLDRALLDGRLQIGFGF